MNCTRYTVRLLERADLFRCYTGNRNEWALLVLETDQFARRHSRIGYPFPEDLYDMLLPHVRDHPIWCKCLEGRGFGVEDEIAWTKRFTACVVVHEWENVLRDRGR